MHLPPMPWAYIFFCASSTRFLSNASASIFFSSPFSRFRSLQAAGLLHLHLPKLPLPPVEGYLLEVVLTAYFRDRYSFIRLPQYADLFFRRVSLAFHQSGSFLRPQTNSSHGSKKRSHVRRSLGVRSLRLQCRKLATSVFLSRLHAHDDNESMVNVACPTA